MTDRLTDHRLPSTLQRVHSGYSAARRVIGVIACILLLMYGVQQLTHASVSGTAEDPSVDTHTPPVTNQAAAATPSHRLPSVSS
jgi:hypothetical protein